MKTWFWEVLVWADQGLNVIFGKLLNKIFDIDGFGSSDETLSSVFGKYRNRCRLCHWLCVVLEWLDPGHCAKSIEEDERGPYVKK